MAYYASLRSRYALMVALVIALWSQQSTSFVAPLMPRSVQPFHLATSGRRHLPSGACAYRQGKRLASSGTPSRDDAVEEVPKSLDRSAPPAFIKDNNITFDKPFVISKEGEPTPEELSNENLLQIVAQACADEEVNWLAWKCLGYRYNAATNTWSADEVFPQWKKRYPETPDLVGVTRNYTREVDAPVFEAVRAMTWSIPEEHKGGVKTELRPLGFTGLNLNELTPNRTRRAQVVNFVIYFRKQLQGVSFEELERRRQARREALEASGISPARSPLTKEDDAKSPEKPNN